MSKTWTPEREKASP